MFIDFIGLSTLALLQECPRHPYDLHRIIRARRWDQAFHIGGLPRSLYHAIDRLARFHLIEPVETTREGNRPERTVYQITEEGRQEFRSRLRSLLETPAAERPVLPAALGLAGYASPGMLLDALEGRVVVLMAEVAAREAALRALKEQMRLPRVVLIGAEWELAQSRAELDWVRSLVEELRAGTLTWDWESLASHFAAEHSRREGLGPMS
jgi:DNA-binding PadR family transcriptional regulator